MRNLVPQPILDAAAAGRTEGTVTGSVLLVDAAGSTRLAAELSLHATAGAEALADVLTAVFTPIVSAVHRYGGFVAQFTGDGVLAVFPGDLTESARAAATAGLDIRGTLTTMHPVTTPAGVLRLRVRVVAATGTVAWSIWTTDDDEPEQRKAFTFLGEALDDAQAAEPHVDGGQIALAPATMRHLGDDAVTEELPYDDAILISSLARPAPPAREPSIGPVTEVAGDFNPTGVLSFPSRGEFRDVVSAFVGVRTVSGDTFDRVSRSAVLDAVSRHGGYLCDITRPHRNDDGVTLFVFWGAPTTHERDVEHACGFVLELREVLGAGAVRAGLTSETVFAGFVGSPVQEAYTCVGSGVNLAARMCAAAPWGEIYVGDRLPSRLGPDMRAVALGNMPYRGFDEPVATYRLEGAPSRPAAGPGTLLVGRDSERARLADAIRASSAGSRVIAVCGEAGMGKSDLLDAVHTDMVAATPPPLWLEARADELRRDPLAPLHSALWSRFRTSDPINATRRFTRAVDSLVRRNADLEHELRLARTALSPFLETRAVPDDGLDARNRFERTMVAITALLTAEARSRPVVVDVRDAQWLDPAALTVIARLRDDLADLPLTILLETRSAPDTEADVTMHLDGLPRSGIQELVEQTLGAAISSSTVDALMDRTGGNPFFARQLAQYMSESGFLSPSGEGLAVTQTAEVIPTELRPLLVARLDRLPTQTGRVVLAASVLGQEFEMKVLAAMLPDLPDLTAAVGGAVAGGVWNPVEDARYRFSTALLRDAAYDLHLKSALRSLHADAAEAILATHDAGSTEHATELAMHFDLAELPDRALPHHVASARRAAQNYANDRAIADFTRALSIVGAHDPAQRRALLTELADVYDVVGDRDAQDRTIAAIEDLTGDDPTLRTEAAQLRIPWHIALGEYDLAGAAVERALETAGMSTLQRAELLMLEARVLRYQGETARSAAVAKQTEAAFSASGDERGVAVAQDLQGGLAWEMGAYDQAVTLHREAAALFSHVGDRVAEISALNNLGTALFASGDYAAAHAIHSAGVRRSRAIGYRMAEGDHLDNRGGTAWAVGAYESAAADYAAALEIRRSMRDAWGVAISLSNLGATARVCGDLALARKHYEEALAIDRDIGRRRGEAYDLHGLGLVHRDDANFATAGELLTAAAELRSDLGETHLANESRAALADVLRHTGDLAAAEALVEAALASEAESRFGAAVETTASLLHCYHVLAATSPQRAAALLADISSALEERAARISDDEQRRTYLDDVPSHAEVRALAADL